MLYIFGGYPILNAGGIQHAIETVENLANLEHDAAIQYAREGVFSVGRTGAERLGSVEYWLSPLLESVGISWDWFPENWGFGNGVSVHKTTALRETMLVDHRSGQSVDDMLVVGRAPLDLSKLLIQRVPKRTEGWQKYERRWRPGTCPQESHIVHLTWMVAKHRIPDFALGRLRDLIESPSGQLRDVERYRERDFSPARRWDGRQQIKGLLA